jgi:hypothetical protein
VPLQPPQYVEWLEIEDPSIAAGSETGRRALAILERGGGLAAWTVQVEDIEAASARVGLDVFTGTTKVEGGALRHWYSVTRDLDLPVLIAYDDPDGSRRGRWQAAYENLGHTNVPRGIERVDVGNDPAELGAWLGPHDLPVAYVDGGPGVHAVHVATANGPLVLA